MGSFPEWVPRDVIDYFRTFHGRPEDLRISEFDEEDFDALGRCIQSIECERLWNAISRRSGVCNPQKFAKTIVKISWLARSIEDRYPSKSEIQGYRKLAEKVRDLLDDVHEVFEQSTVERVNKIFRVGGGRYEGELPHDYLQDLADRLDRSADVYTDLRKSLKEMTGKPESTSAKQTYVLRCLYENTSRLYGTPLHDAVATVASEILGHRVEAEQARSIYRISRK